MTALSPTAPSPSAPSPTEMTRAVALVVRPAAALRGSPRLPGDKSISHRALLLGLLAEGRSTIVGLSEGEDVRSTRSIIEALGARVEVGDVDASDRVTVDSDGLASLTPPSRPLDCGNAGTTMRLVAGILAGQPFAATLDGDDSLRSRPMGRVIEPLRAMGASVSAAAGDRAPLEIGGRAHLTAIDWTPEVASAQVKSAILLAGLRADGTTIVRESVATRDHTERMLRARGVAVRSRDDGRGGDVVELDGGQAVRPYDESIPGDVSAAAFWLVAGVAHPDASLELEAVGINPGRRAAIDLLREMGGDIEERRAISAQGGTLDPEPGEPAADLVVRSSNLRSIDVDGRSVAAAIDEIPVLALAATQARGTSRFRSIGELRVKESDRIAGIVAGLRALGADIAVDGNDLVVVGPTPLHGAEVDGQADHRLVMTFAIAGLLAAGQTTIHGAASHAISDPGFLTELERIRP
ncbi:MAG TPA: 3-phosphoshikimate 1-carboxyvinyltransferase [Candidatus Limnocylindrales bacterium]|nr:3-phosphoshikimate 1-carboxyvinyltransferase [Candidatus Limnocylindrales bacterium]